MTKLLNTSKKVTILALGLLLVVGLTACAPRHCAQHYSNACFKADDAKARVFGNYAEQHDPVARVIILNGGQAI